ncbi:NADH:flavin oxidoreductase/NADH oxidase [Celerinatantimonas diazotrophica]|uniref:2,4-dienoyl-CoA reductase-like NADH-dependent reductase (Old Yellow Enzyme family) n=1 Tax=Celerinatantimonas diazotrophica TaxID=412034 RepID=A0A4R1K4P2_9GAMM|nr:NADH:flavin oxidoreductase/NADH oxidase [Celerinatantimonas diazotrophica]TCK58897.1 2,4-dienoyl-CoA reductase-like NADH-dependent reductase (Old Yellow Enzyme family) [Celerinatantimonas diazotrophica]CAG9297529.1 NADPH dehydrogenase [Celerinatantimonas diazotrophica]
MSKLFTPLKLADLELPNRVIVAPMCMYSAEHGKMTDWHIQHLGSLSQSGAGMLIIEASAVEPQGRISYGDVGLWDDLTEQAMGRVLESVRRYSDIPIGVQLGHAGRKASCEVSWKGGAQIDPNHELGWQTIAPSDIPVNKGDTPPLAMTLEDIEAVKTNFVSAAQRAAKLGLDAIEIHGAHGYLLHQFLSPLSNRRDDEYGGSLENRMRFVLEVFEGIREVFPKEKPVGIRISASDWVDGGWDIAQSIELAKALEERGCSYIHVSSGGLSAAQKIDIGPGYQLKCAHQIKAALEQMPVIAVGLITDAHQAESILISGQADAIALARGILYDPRWAWHAAAALGEHVTPAPQYLRCAPHNAKDLFNA